MRRECEDTITPYTALTAVELRPPIESRRVFRITCLLENAALNTAQITANESALT